MNDECAGHKPVFTDSDRLLLLQLMTRRAMSDRAVDDRHETAEEEGGDGLETVAEHAQIPDRWRLMPEQISLYTWQQECLSKWLEQGRGTVKVATGGGKTLFALAAAQALQNEREPDLRLVIVVPTIPLMHQWRDELLRGNIPASAIGMMGGGQVTPPLSELRILICVLNSARDRLAGLTGNAGWSMHMMLVVDECHRAGANQARRIFDAKPRYTLGLSATPEQNDDADLPSDAAYSEGVIGQALGPIIYDFTLQQSLAAGLLTRFEVWHVGLSLAPQEASEHARLSREITELRKPLQRRHRESRTRQGFIPWCQTQARRGGPAAHDAERFIGLAGQRKRLLYRASARAEAVLGILSESLTDQDGRGIVFHEVIAEIERLFLSALEREIPVVLEHSQLPDSLRADNIEAFRKGIARVIISAKSLVEGFNVPSADLGVIAASSSSVRQRIQSLGRMLRRKPGGRTARVYVLYVRDTEDESIYGRADWENVIGAERNRYFVWQPEEGGRWPDGLSETGDPPRIYLPPAHEIDITTVIAGERYPARPEGQDVRVDQDGNLRTEEGLILRVPRPLVDAILGRAANRRARITPAGHLIVRSAAEGREDPAHWIYLGVIDAEPEQPPPSAIRLRLQTVRGRRRIARERARGHIGFALGSSEASQPEAGQACDQLLEWIRSEEGRLNRGIRDLYWDGGTRYWLEIEGERVFSPHALAPLEFGG